MAQELRLRQGVVTVPCPGMVVETALVLPLEPKDVRSRIAAPQQVVFRHVSTQAMSCLAISNGYRLFKEITLGIMVSKYMYTLLLY